MNKYLSPSLALSLLLVAGSARAQIVSGSAKVEPKRASFPMQTFFPGLWQVRNGDQSTERRELGPVMAFTNRSYTSPIDQVVSQWQEFDTWTYDGEMYMVAGTSYTFASQIDDYVTISIDGRTVLNQPQCAFATGTFACRETGWHTIAVKMWDTGGGYGWMREFAPGIAYNTAGQTNQTPAENWTQLVDPGNGTLFRTRYRGVRVSAQMRKDDPTVMDVNYIVYTDPAETPAVNVRALAFENGERGFGTIVRPENFIENTGVYLGDSITANIEYHLAWKIPTDWDTDLAKVVFEVMAMKPGDGLLPLHLVTIPAADGHPTMTASVEALPYEYRVDREGFFYHLWDCPIQIIQIPTLLDALLWLYAGKEADLVLGSWGVLYHQIDQDGVQSGVDVVRHDGFWHDCDDISEEDRTIAAYEYVFGKMGFQLLQGNELRWVNQELRMELTPSIRLNPRQYAVRMDSE